jgi:hypothetical protein
MTTDFDGSSGGTQAPSALIPGAKDTGFSTLSLLKQTVADRIEIEPVTVTVPGGRIRLTCHTDIPEKDLRRWQKASLPREMRRGREAQNATPLDSSQLVLAVAVLVYSTITIEVLGKGDEWMVVEHDGVPLSLDHDAVLSAFNALDTTSALVTIFGRESDIIQASQEVLAASGWTGENGGRDEGDPQ